MKTFREYLKESPKYGIGDWIEQKHSDGSVYGLIVDKQKNGAFRAVIFDNLGGSTAGKAKLKSLKNWYPDPKLIDMKSVPSKIQQKIMVKAEKYT